MSTKTVTKRVALATVVALGAGVLSLVSVSSANASANVAAGTTQTASTSAGVLNIATAANTTGIAYNGGGSASSALSQGLLSVSDVAGGLVAGTSQTATLLSTGAIEVYTTGTANKATLISVAGGTISASLSSVSANGTFNNTNTSVATTGTATMVIGITPNAGVSSFTISAYNSSDTQANLQATPSSGVLFGQIVVSVATSSTSGTVSLTNSKIYYNALSNGVSTTGAVTSATTTVGVGTSDFATPQYASILPKDAYGVLLGAGSLVQATATNGAYVALAANGSGMATAPTSAGTSSAAFTTTYAATAVGMAVGAGALAANGGQTVVTVSVNGVAIGTIAFTFTGKVAKVTLSAAGNGQNGGAGTGNSATVAFSDAAGNTISWPAGAATTAYPQSLTKDTNGFKGFGTGLSTVTWPNRTVSTGAVAAGSFLFTCTQNATDSAQLDYTNADGSIVVSNSLPFSCSGAPYTYTAKLDKASYAPGDIAVLSVTFKDSTGALAADIVAGQPGAITTGTGTTTVPVIAGGQLTSVSAPTNADSTTNGVATYKFIVGSTAGNYSASVSFPTVNASNAVAGAQTVSYKIVDGSTSLNDVLKGIVSLIASINKQIAALAKLVTKK